MRRLRRVAGLLVLAALIAAILYLPARRFLLDHGMISAGTFRSQNGRTLTLWDDNHYALDRSRGGYSVERFADAPWISCVRLDNGVALYVKYGDRVYQVEDIREMTGKGDDRFARQ